MAKNKMKTKKAAAKRFEFTATGKVKYKRCNQSTNTALSRSSRRLKRSQKLDGELVEGDAKQAKTMVPYWRKRRKK